MSKKCDNIWCSKIKTAGSKITEPRQVIIHTLQHVKKHMTVEELYMKIRKIDKTIGLATIYRTLDLLQNNGLIYKIDLGDGRSWYEIAMSADKGKYNQHMVCVKCGRVTDLELVPPEEKNGFEKILDALEKEKGFRVNNCSIRINGLCSKCAGK